MKILRSKDDLVSKFIHKDGSETAIKSIKSLYNKRDKDNNIEIAYKDRNKYSIFISVSTGCQFKCKFCYLTMKNAKYHNLTKDDIVNNIKEAIVQEIKHKPSLKSKFVKLSWMGMGDALNQSSLVKEATIEILDFIIDNGYAIGLDGVDLSTVLPKTSDVWINNFQTLENDLRKYQNNENDYIKDNVDYSSSKTYKNRSLFRLFYSIGSSTQESKNEIIPNVLETVKAIKLLKKYSSNNKYNVIFHYMFVEGLNSTLEDVDEFINMYRRFNLEDYEIRILRYNECTNQHKETKCFDKIINKLKDIIVNLKVQVSAGSEVKSACGQFIVTQFKNT